jgi:hypothetical protein
MFLGFSLSLFGVIGVATDSSFERYHQSTIDCFHPFLISQFIALMQLSSFLFPIFPLFILDLRLTILGFASAVIEVEGKTLEFLTEIEKRCCDSIAGWSSRKRTTHCHSRLQAMATRAASRIAVRAAAAARASVASYFPAQLSEATESLNRWTPGNHQVRYLNVHEYQVSLLLSFPCCWDCRSFLGQWPRPGFRVQSHPIMVCSMLGFHQMRFH